MLTIYNGAAICGYEQPFECSLRLQPHLRDVSVGFVITIGICFLILSVGVNSLDHGKVSRLG